MLHFDPQETIDLYKRLRVTPMSGRLVDNTKTGACALGVHYLHRLSKTDYSDGDAVAILQITPDWFLGFADGFDGRSVELDSGKTDYNDGFDNGKEVRGAVLKEFGEIISWTQFVAKTTGKCKVDNDNPD